MKPFELYIPDTWRHISKRHKTVDSYFHGEISKFWQQNIVVWNKNVCSDIPKFVPLGFTVYVVTCINIHNTILKIDVIINMFINKCYKMRNHSEKQGDETILNEYSIS